MAITTTQSAQLYLAYFGRPADPAGQNFWTQPDSTNTMQQQSNAFATAPEWTSAIAGMTNDQIVNLIYINSFGRSPEPAGLRFWSDAITNGVLSVGDAAWQIVSNTGPADAAIVAAKVEAAIGYTAAVAADSADSIAYGNSAAFASANSWLDGITTSAEATAALVPATLSASLDAMVVASNDSAATTYALTTDIDTINAAVLGANVLNTVTSGLQDGTATQTWNTGDSITGNNLTTVSLIANGGAASVVSVTNVAAINMNLVASSTLNAGQFSNVAAVNVTNGVAASVLTVTNATLATTYGVSSANNYGVTLQYAGATGSADTAKLSASGTGNSTTDTTFDVANGNVIEAITLATSGTNFLTVNGGTGAATITVTGAGTNEVTIGSAATTMTYDASATTGDNVVNIGTLLSTTDVFEGGTGTCDELIADLTSAVQIIPVITGIEELELTFTAAATFNASSWTGGDELDLTPTGNVVATVTNLNQTVTTLGIGEAAAIAATGAVNIGYATGASSAVTLYVGATSTSSNPAVSSTGALTITGNAGALTINSVGDAANTLGAVTANAVSALTIAGVAQNLTTGAVSATTAATVTIDGTLKNTVVTTATASANSLTVDESMTTFNLTAGAGTATLTSTNGTPGNAITQTAVSAAIATTYNITSGAKAATIGTLAASTATADENLNATINLTGGVAAITTGVLSFTGSGAATADLTNVTLNATATTGLVTIGGLTVNEGTLGTSSTNVNLTANGGDVTLTTLTLTDSDAGNIVASATNGETVTIGTLTTNAGATDSIINTITASGAGSVSLFNTGTDVIDGDIVVVASGLTGALTLGLGSATGNLNVTLGNAASGFTNTVTTGGGADVIVGGTGADTISTGAGNDVISAGNGTNSITGGAGADVMSGGTGVDSYVQASGDSQVIASKAISSGTITSYTFSTSDNISGLGTSDTITLGNANVVAANFAVTANNTFSVADDSGTYIHGNYIAATNAFSYSATGTDTMLVYDADSTTAVSVESIVLVGFAGTLASVAGVLTAS